MSSILSARNLIMRYGSHVVVDVPSIEVDAGKWTAIVGPNGAGKTSLLRVLAGVARHEGTVGLLGKDIRSWNLKERARTLSWLGQNEGSAEDLRAWDVAMLGRVPHQAWLGGPGGKDIAAVERAMTQTQSLQWKDRTLGELSGGERQRVLLARALAVEASLLLMDEPLANLDPPHQADWIDIVRSCVDQGSSVVSVLHEINIAMRADVLVVMREGKVVHQGASMDGSTHRALIDVFEKRISIHEVEGEWVVLPRSVKPKNL